MPTPEIHPPSPGDYFLLDAPRPPRTPLHEPEDPSSFAEVFNGKGVHAPLPDPRPEPDGDPVDDAPPAQDPPPVRDSGADEPIATEQSDESPDTPEAPDAPPASEVAPPVDSPTPEVEPDIVIQTVPAPGAPHATPESAAIPNPQQNTGEKSTAPPPDPRATASTQPHPAAVGSDPSPSPSGTQNQPVAAAPPAAVSESKQPAPPTTPPQQVLPAEQHDSSHAKQLAQTNIAPITADQVKQTDQPTAEQARPQSAPAMQSPGAGASTQNPTDQQPQGNQNNSSADQHTQSVFKAAPAQDHSEPTYRPEAPAPQADARAAAPSIAPQGEPLTPPKLGVQSTPQPQDPGHLTQEQIGKFRAGLVKGFNAVLRTSGGSLSMHLTPPTLGKVSIEMTMQEGRVDVRLSAANEQAHRLLNENLAMLRTTLESKGLKVDRLAVQVSTSAAQSQSASPAQNAHQNTDSQQQANDHDAGQGQSRGRSDQDNDSSPGGDRPEDPGLGIDQATSERGGASFAHRLELSLDAVA